ELAIVGFEGLHFVYFSANPLNYAFDPLLRKPIQMHEIVFLQGIFQHVVAVCLFSQERILYFVVNLGAGDEVARIAPQSNAGDDAKKAHGNSSSEKLWSALVIRSYHGGAVHPLDGNNGFRKSVLNGTARRTGLHETSNRLMSNPS